MEVPASLYALRVAGAKGPRALNAIELGLAAAVYSHAVITDERPTCWLTFPAIADKLGRAGSVAKLKAASRVIAAAGYWRRVVVGGRHVWVIEVRPSDAGHRWQDQVGYEPTEARSGPTPRPDPGVPDPASPRGQIRPPPEARSGLPPRPDPASHISNHQEPSGDHQDPPLPPEGDGFRLHALSVPKPRTTKPAKGACTDEQWSVVVQAWNEARSLGGMSPTWGRWRDNPTNRRLAARIWADGYTDADLLEVMRHIGRRLAIGAHDPQWTSLEHVARHVGRYLNEAAGQGPPRPGRGINPLCEPIARPPPDPRAVAAPPEYIPDPPDDDWMRP